MSIGKYICERSSKNFIGQVVDGQGDLIKVKFVRRKDLGSNSFKWPEKDDVDMVSRVNVVKNVAEPQTDRRGLLSFDDELTKDYNIE